MSKPNNLKTRIFLDSGDPNDTQKALDAIGFLDGQTTNPSLIAKSPEAQARLQLGNRFSETELLDFYKSTINNIAILIPDGFVSIEVFANQNSIPQDLLIQAKEMQTWTPNNHIKFPIIPSGVEAAINIVMLKGQVNMTLCFNQSQALAIHQALGNAAPPNQVLISPFVGRLNDKGQNGLSLIANIQQMYRELNSPVQVLAASIRTLEDFMELLAMEVDIITAPLNILEAWAGSGMTVPEPRQTLRSTSLTNIPYQKMDSNSSWQGINIQDPMTDAGLDKFVKDWKGLMATDK